MLRTVLTAMSVLILTGAAVPALADECKGCDKIAKGSDGFCCGKGSVFGVKLTSQKLYDALKGREVSQKDIRDFRCSGCKRAEKTNGSCDQCRFVGGKMYSSWLAYTLAKGAPMSAELVKACPKKCGTQCNRALKKDGRCSSCEIGFVAGRMFESGELYEAALAAYTTLKKAAKTASSCEQGAVAMVADGSCSKCKLTFKNGKIVPNKD